MAISEIVDRCMSYENQIYNSVHFIFPNLLFFAVRI